MADKILSSNDYVNKVRSANNTWYVTSSQAKIYISGIWIDDCYDIQYQYHESKQPVYGYNSKYYDDVLPGQVIITGAFTINYRHDGYLSLILEKVIKDQVQYGSDIGGALKKKKDIEEATRNYKSVLMEYKKLVERKELLEAEKLVLKDQKNVLNNTFMQKKSSQNAALSTFNESLDDAWANYKMRYSELSINSQGLMDRWIQLHKYVNGQDGKTILTAADALKYRTEMGQIYAYPQESGKPSLRTVIDLYMYFMRLGSDRQLGMSPYVDEAGTAGANYKHNIDKSSYIESELGKINTLINSLKNDLATLKERKFSIDEEIVDLLSKAQSEGSDKLNGAYNRPEDYNDGFDLFVDYNEVTHKVLRGCRLVGHSHAIMTSGEPVKEYYTFIAQKIE